MPNSLSNYLPLLRRRRKLNFNIPIFTEEQKRILIDAYEVLHQDIQDDTRKWPFTSSGNFTIKSYIQYCQKDRPSFTVLKRIWYHFVPTKISIFTWKLLRGAIPTDAAVIKCHIPLVSRCSCCTSPSTESSAHLFLGSELAIPIWKYFQDLFEIRLPRFYNIRLLLSQWFRKGKAGSMEFLCCTLVPLFIIWEVWKERCSRRYDEDYKVLHQASKQIIWRVKLWIARLCEHYTPSKRSSSSFEMASEDLRIESKNPPLALPILVYWSRPNPGYIGLNTDGACQNGVAAGGGIIRNQDGDQVANFFSFYGQGTNNLAETRALLDGLKLCLWLGYSKVHLQVDSDLAVMWLNKKIARPWNLSNWWKQIYNIAAGMDIRCNHVFREGNTAADHLSKKGLTVKADGAINKFQDRDFKQILHGDKFNIPQIRIAK